MYLIIIKNEGEGEQYVWYKGKKQIKMGFVDIERKERGCVCVMSSFLWFGEC